MADRLSSPAAAVAAEGAASSSGAAAEDQASNQACEATERDKRRLVSKAQKLAREARANTNPAAMSPILLRWVHARSAAAHQDAQLWRELKQACEIFYTACAGTGLEDPGNPPAGATHSQAPDA